MAQRRNVSRETAAGLAALRARDSTAGRRHAVGQYVSGVRNSLRTAARVRIPAPRGALVCEELHARTLQGDRDGGSSAVHVRPTSAGLASGRAGESVDWAQGALRESRFHVAYRGPNCSGKRCTAEPPLRTHGAPGVSGALAMDGRRRGLLGQSLDAALRARGLLSAAPRRSPRDDCRRPSRLAAPRRRDSRSPYVGAFAELRRGVETRLVAVDARGHFAARAPANRTQCRAFYRIARRSRRQGRSREKARWLVRSPPAELSALDVGRRIRRRHQLTVAGRDGRAAAVVSRAHRI